MRQRRLHPTPPSITRKGRIALVLALAIFPDACRTSDPFDASQVPRITATTNPSIPTVRFTWIPDGAQRLRVFKGSVVDTNPVNLWWSATATGKNTMLSGIEYGATVIIGGTRDMPQKSFVRGQTYTVEISRIDPKSNDSGPTAAANARYTNTKTFALPASVVPP